MLSIIVPVYKTEQYLRQCVASICEQTYANLEIILIDDGSPDNCGAICDELAALDKRVKVIHKLNGGVSDARNVGVANACGQYIGFVDSDDTLESDFFERLLCYAQKNACDIVCSDSKLYKGNKCAKKISYFKDNKIFVAQEGLCTVLSNKLGNSVWNKLFARKLFQDVFFPQGRIYEDAATLYQLAAKANRIGYVHYAGYNYIRHDNSIISNAIDAKSSYQHYLAYKERLQFAQKNKLCCLSACRALAVRRALSAYRVACVENSIEAGQYQEELEEFIRGQIKEPVALSLRPKDRLLLWFWAHHHAAYRAMAKMLMWLKTH